MKINKIILRIYHFLGFKKGQEHIDDVMMVIDTHRWSKGEIDDWSYTGNRKKDDSEYVIEDIKSQIRSKFEACPKFEKRCRNAHQVWIVLQPKGGLVKMLYYRDGNLYYPCDVDRKAKERDDKIIEVLK